MIHRLVLLKLNDAADAAVHNRMQVYASRLASELDETLSYQLVPNRITTDDGYNWLIVAGFASEADMDAYRRAPLHQEFVSYCDPYTENFCAVCY